MEQIAQKNLYISHRLEDNKAKARRWEWKANETKLKHSVLLNNNSKLEPLVANYFALHKYGARLVEKQELFKKIIPEKILIAQTRRKIPFCYNPDLSIHPRIWSQMINGDAVT